MSQTALLTTCFTKKLLETFSVFSLDRKTVVYTLALFFTLSGALTGKQVDAAEVVYVDGREVLLKDDGSWIYQSTDRYVNTQDGTRVRLKTDGSWQAIGNAQLISKQQVRTRNLDITLQKVEIESYKKKVHKNTKVKTQTVFYLNITHSPVAKENIQLAQTHITHIKVKNDRGGNYPVIAMTPNNIVLQPGSVMQLQIRAEKSPAEWESLNSIDIIFEAGIFGLTSPLTFTQRVIDIDTISVDGFN